MNLNELCDKMAKERTKQNKDASNLFLSQLYFRIGWNDRDFVAKKELAEIKNESGFSIKDYLDLKDKNKKLTKALEFYASETNWVGLNDDSRYVGVIVGDYNLGSRRIGGERARKTLKEVGD